MCNGDCSSKHQVMLDTITKLHHQLFEATELLNMYRVMSIEHEQEVERLHETIAKQERSLLLHRDPDAYVSAVTRERILPL